MFLDQDSNPHGGKLFVRESRRILHERILHSLLPRLTTLLIPFPILVIPILKRNPAIYLVSPSFSSIDKKILVSLRILKKRVGSIEDRSKWKETFSTVKSRMMMMMIQSKYSIRFFPLDLVFFFIFIFLKFELFPPRNRSWRKIFDKC